MNGTAERTVKVAVARKRGDRSTVIVTSPKGGRREVRLHAMRGWDDAGRSLAYLLEVGAVHGGFAVLTMTQMQRVAKHSEPED